jgi:hypothetical protein
MNCFAESIEQREKGARLLDESSNLYRLASESESMSEILKLSLEAVNKDLEALAIIWEATIAYKKAIEELQEFWQMELREFETEILDINP